MANRGTGRARLVRWGLALAGFVVVVALLPQLVTRLGGQAGTSSGEGTGRHVVRDLDSIDTLREAFNQDPGHVRVVLLLSPT